MIVVWGFAIYCVVGCGRPEMTMSPVYYSTAAACERAAAEFKAAHPGRYDHNCMQHALMKNEVGVPIVD